MSAEPKKLNWQRVGKINVKAANWRTILNFVALGAVLYLLITKAAEINISLHTAVHGQPGWLIVAVLTLVGTFFAASAAFYFICKQEVPFFGLLKAEVASAFTSRLLPANAGGLALNIQYISTHIKNRAQAVGLVGLNSIVGFVAYMASVLGLVVFLHRPFSQVFQLHIPMWLWWLAIGLVIASLVTIISSKTVQTKVGLWRHDLTKIILTFKKSPQYLGYGFVSYVVLTTLYVSTLFACLTALGVHISFVQVFAVFTVGLTAGSVTPTPGGIIGVEIGLYSGLLATGVSSSLALSSVLVYRLLTYWLPIIPGFLMFRHLLKHNIV